MALDWAGLLARKYDLLQQNANADTVRARASANLDNVRAGLMPAESRANIGLTEAQRGFTNSNAGLADARAAETTENTKYIGDLARANISEGRARSRLYGSQANTEDIMNRNFRFTFRGLGDGLGQINDMSRRLPFDLKGFGFNWDWNKPSE